MTAGRAILIVAALAAGVAILSSVEVGRTPEGPSVALPAAPVAPPPLPPEIKLGRLDSSYGVLKGSFTLKNPNAFAIKDPEIVCSVIAPSGTVISRYRFRVFEVIGPGGSKGVRNHTFGIWPEQGKSVSCEGNSAVRS